MSTENCSICLEKSTIFSFGTCFHPVCYKCSTKNRVLIENYDCPLCNKYLNKVLYSELLEPLNSNKHVKSKFIISKHSQHGIIFANINVKNTYDQLFRYNCNDGCSLEFGTFESMTQHMKMKHAKSFCTMCMQNLKLFSSERRFYTDVGLKNHVEHGDTDGKFHSHPICEFCNLRFFDDGKLMRHLQRKHLTCHVCDDSNHIFYSGQSELWNHLCSEHFACEFSRCSSAFKTKKKLENHIFKKHKCQIQNNEQNGNLVTNAKEVIMGCKKNLETCITFENENDLTIRCAADKNVDNTKKQKKLNM